MKYEDLGKRIRKLRKQARMTQEQLAHATGMSPSFIGHIERGTRKVSLDTLSEIARVLGVTSSSLMSESAEPVPASRNGRTAYTLGSSPATDISFLEPKGEVELTPLTNEDTRRYMLRELIALLEEKD